MFGKANLELTRNPWLMRRGRDLVELGFRLSRLPGVRKIHPWTTPRGTEMRWLPVNRDLSMPQGIPLPLELLDRLIAEASHRVVLEYCGCRRASRCSGYPEEVGCLLLGDDALRAAPSLSREVSAEEARSHAGRAVEAGLVPAVGTARVDDLVFGVKRPKRMLTVCFCCECCCLGRYLRHVPLGSLDAIFPRLPGVEVRVTGDCDGCGACVERCYLGAIEIRDERAVHSAYCRACGRCAAACPRGAVEVVLSDPGFLEETYRRIRARMDHT